MRTPRTPITKVGLEQYDHLPAVDAVLKAWTEAGIHPDWHRKSQRAVTKSMPVLSRALERLARNTSKEVKEWLR